MDPPTAVRASLRRASAGPGGNLLEGVNPDESLPWCIDYLACVGSLADALCRRRETRRSGEFASLLPGVSHAAWPLDERYALYSQLKRTSSHRRPLTRTQRRARATASVSDTRARMCSRLSPFALGPTRRGAYACTVWSSNGDGLTVKRAEEIELRYKLREESDEAKRRNLAVRLERGARRRLQYTHWAISQLLATGPLLPLHELSEEQLESELEWAVAAEGEAAFIMLRPLLTFHFNALVPVPCIEPHHVCPASLPCSLSTSEPHLTIPSDP
jgi:hypothetical protein